MKKLTFAVMYYDWGGKLRSAFVESISEKGAKMVFNKNNKCCHLKAIRADKVKGL